MRFSMVHAADLHLDSPLLGLTRYDGAPVVEMRGATRRALENLVTLCIEENARLLLLAGDLYDGDLRDYSTGLFMAAQFARLLEVGTRVVWVRGNHDAQSRITRHLSLGEHCRELSARRPETQVFEDLGVAVHGQGFATAAVTEDLSAGYPEPISGALNVGLLHTALAGTTGHAPYAPCDARALAQRGYDYWALGHVHRRQEVSCAPWIVFPGNLQGRHVRETGAKGATLIHVEDGAVRAVEHRALDVVRFGQCDVDVQAARSLGDVAELAKSAVAEGLKAADGRLLAARITLSGASAVHSLLIDDPERAVAEIRARANELREGEAWIEGVKLATEPVAERKLLSERDDAVGELLRYLSELESDPAEREPLLADLHAFVRGLPHELRGSEGELDLSDPENASALVRQASGLILARLFGAS